MLARASFLFSTVIVASALQTPMPAPTFRTDTKLVEVDVVAHRGSHPAEGLTQDDFTLLDNGVPQRIAVFSVRSAKGSGTPAVPLPSGAVSNRVNRNGESPATATVILMDQIFTGPAGQRNTSVVKFLEKRGNKDRIGLYSVSLAGVRIMQELTQDPDKHA